MQQQGSELVVPTPTTSLGDLVAPIRWPLAAACGLQVVASAASVGPFVAVAEIVRRLLGDGAVDADQLWRLGRLAMLAFFVQGVAGLVAGALTHYADNDLQLVLRRRMAAKLRRVPLGWFSHRSLGEVKKAVGDDVAEMHHVVAHAILDLTGAVVVPIVSIAYCFSVDWRLALVAVVPLVVGFGLYARQMAVSARYVPGYDEHLAAVNAAAVEFVHGIAVVKTFGQARRAHQRFLDAALGFVEFFWSMVRGMLRLSAANEVLMAPLTALALVLAAGTWFVDAGWSTTAAVGAIAVLGVNLCTPVMALGHSAHTLQQASRAAARVGVVLDAPELSDRGTAAAPAAPLAVELKEVSFGYDADTTVLHEVSLRLEPGTITALVGRSGSGKSTIAKLVPRFWDADTGTVSIGGVDVRELALDQLHRHVGFVFQDTRLLATSIRDNIALAEPTAPLERVEAAARAAQIHDRIAALPAGYDTVVGGDVLLSGGEVQRIAIARALLADAPVLVLDEATAFADPDSEAAIHDALASLVAGRTVLVVAHRLATIVNVDQIAVVDAGRIVERGRHDDLLADEGAYAALWRAHESLHAASTVGGDR